MDFETALSKLPEGTCFDPYAHHTIEDLCFICLHELDMHAEHEFWHPLALRKKYLAFCKKHKHWAAEAQEQFDIGRYHLKSDSYI